MVVPELYLNQIEICLWENTFHSINYSALFGDGCFNVCFIKPVGQWIHETDWINLAKDEVKWLASIADQAQERL